MGANYTGNGTEEEATLIIEDIDDRDVAELRLWLATFSHYCSVVLTVLAMIALLVNLYLLTCSRYLRRPIGVNLRLCVSLTASDALCASFYVLTFTANVFIIDGVSMCFILLIEVCKYSTFFSSVLTLLALALNHYVGIVYPLRRHMITNRTVRLAMALAYIVPFAFFLALFCIHPGGFRADESFSFFSKDGCAKADIFRSPHFRWMVVFPFILVVLTLSFLYGHILIHMGRIQKDPLLQTTANSNNTKRSSNRKLLVTLVLLAGSACLGWLPTVVQFLVTCDSCLLPPPIKLRAVLGASSMALHILKLIMDAFIYSSRLIEIRYAMFVFSEIIRTKLRKLFRMRNDTPRLPSEFSRYLSETKENRSMRRKKTVILATSPKSEPVAKRATSVVTMSSNGTSLAHPIPHRSNTLHPTRNAYQSRSGEL